MSPAPVPEDSSSAEGPARASLHDPRLDLSQLDRTGLELELIRVRAAAELARLESRGAEIELRLRELLHPALDRSEETPPVPALAESPRASHSDMQACSLAEKKSLRPANESDFEAGQRIVAAGAGGFEADAVRCWEDYLKGLPYSPPRTAEKTPQSDSSPLQLSQNEPPPPLDRELVPQDAMQQDLMQQDLMQEDAMQEDALQQDPLQKECGVRDAPEAEDDSVLSSAATDGLGEEAEEAIFGDGEAVGSTEVSRGKSRRSRRRYAATVASLVSHGIAIVLLGMLTLSLPQAEDAISLSSSASLPERELEAVQFQQSEAPEVASSSAAVVPTEVSTSDLTADATQPMEVASLSPLAEIPLPPAAGGAAAGQGNLSQTLARDVSTSFFGVSGGGNHFVYLVDHSGSMLSVERDGFDVARAEVLRAVDQLREDQRFYVIFFAEQTRAMRLEDPQADEPRSVYATAENKAALRRWAMTVTPHKGAWPREALEKAFELRPDCIFLLTDGEMPERVLTLIEERNMVQTLFEGPKPRSIIHTIGFYSPSGEARLREIARISGGTYRFIAPRGIAKR